MNEQNSNKKRTNWSGIVIGMMIIGIIVVMIFALVNGLREKPIRISKDIILAEIEAGHVESVVAQKIAGNNENLYELNGYFLKDYTYKDENGVEYTMFYEIVTYEQMTLLQDAAIIKDVSFPISPVSNIDGWSIFVTLFTFALIIVFIVIIIRSITSGGANSKAFDFAKSRAKLNKEKSTTFNDVAGCEEEIEELKEVVDFLKSPRKYVEMGARIPKGVLLVGSPGTGKTLLARAVAGEANVPFFSISGSDFVEMFVGVGASRVRDLFKTAKESSPCIIFIDEIDAVGRQRGAGLGGGHDEREQTLNQLLVEMDGFSGNLGIIIIAATNRPDVLDPALLRPGRFDRQITIDLPDIRARAAILTVHARNKKLDPKIKFNDVAARLPGFSGADIANLLNEAALLAARENRKMIIEKDIDEATDRVIMGPAKKSKKYNPNEKKIVAYHEAGHAVIGLKLEKADIVQKVTIIPRGRAGGYNLMTPAEETFLSSKDDLTAKITGYLGGRVSEEIVFGSITTGAYGDFQSATKIARAMVTEYGMSALGPIQYETSSGSVFLGRDYLTEKNFSDQIALEIDKEIRNIITHCYEGAKEIITLNRNLLDTIAKYLLEVETLNKSDIEEITKTGSLKWWDDIKAENTKKDEEPEANSQE